MIAVYITAGIALYIIDVLPAINEQTRRLAAIVIFIYGIYRLVASIIKMKKEKAHENNPEI